MKVIAKSIDMIDWFDKEGMPKTIKFRIEAKNQNKMVIIY
jgi:hypothetical protein